MNYPFGIPIYWQLPHNRREVSGKIRSNRTFQQELRIITLKNRGKLSQPLTKKDPFSLLPIQPPVYIFKGSTYSSINFPKEKAAQPTRRQFSSTKFWHRLHYFQRCKNSKGLGKNILSHLACLFSRLLW